jgi:hypothetical protein
MRHSPSPWHQCRRGAMQFHLGGIAEQPLVPLSLAPPPRRRHRWLRHGTEGCKEHPALHHQGQLGQWLRGARSEALLPYRVLRRHGQCAPPTSLFPPWFGQFRHYSASFPVSAPQPHLQIEIIDFIGGFGRCCCCLNAARRPNEPPSTPMANKCNLFSTWACSMGCVEIAKSFRI